MKVAEMKSSRLQEQHRDWSGDFMLEIQRLYGYEKRILTYRTPSNLQPDGGTDGANLK